MVVGAAEREGVLRPDDGAGPFAAGLLPDAMQRRPFGRGHADVASALGHGEQVGQGGAEEVGEPATERVIGDGHLGRGAALVGDVIRRIDEAHVRQVAGAEGALNVLDPGGVTAQQAVLAAEP